MTPEETIGLGLVAFGAGAFGGMFGLGGGIILVPAMKEWFHLPTEKVVAASLIGIVATSIASSLVYLKRDLVDLSLANRLLLMTVIGSVAGAWIGKMLFNQAAGERVLAGLFAVIIIAAMFFLFRRKEADDGNASDDLRVQPAAYGSVFGGGVISSLLGVGGGIINVPTITILVGAPVRVSMATSAFMIGVTAASGSAIYLMHGSVDPTVAGPTLLGLFLGAQVGARTSRYVSGKGLRLSFCVVLLYMLFLQGRRALGVG